MIYNHSKNPKRQLELLFKQINDLGGSKQSCRAYPWGAGLAMDNFQSMILLIG